MLGNMAGTPWDPATGELSAQVSAGYVDMHPAEPLTAPTTGIFIGETVGTFNPTSLQALTSGIWMETRKYLAMAATSTGQDALLKLNIPAVEVGKGDFSGSNGQFSVTINDLKFFATSAGARPQLFATENINGTFSVPSPLGSATLAQTAGVATSGISPVFSIDRWDTTTNKWSASLSFNGTSGVVGSYGNIHMVGSAAGTSSGGSSGTFTGTAAGIVK